MKTQAAPTDKTEKLKTRKEFVQKWLAEIETAQKREKTFRDDGKRVTALYEQQKKEGDSSTFNILYSNTETLSPALYNSLPRPVVKRRFNDKDALGQYGAQIVERILTHYIDTNEEATTPLDSLLQAAVLQSLVPGRGITCFEYEAGIAKTDGDESEEKLTGEYVCGEDVSWNMMVHGYAKRWKQVPWIAFEHQMTKQELVDNFGKEIAEQVNMTAASDDDKADGRSGSRGEDSKGVELCCVWKVWDKATRQVLFVSAGYPDDTLKPPVDDPLGLTGFFPIPEPLRMVPKISTITPTALYRMYETQAKELNSISVRIISLIAMCKVRGFYDATLESISKVLEAEDGVLIPAENAMALQAQGMSIDKAIWLMPLEKVVAVLQQLYLQRTQCKQVIYEITGISDILRGASVASETATAQNIKNQWGSLRLKRMQKLVSGYVRDCLRIVAEIAVTKFSQETIISMTGLPFPTQQKKAEAQQMVEQGKAQYQQQAMMAQQQGQQPPPPPQIPPELEELLGMPTWEELLAMLKSDMQRAYKIDVETNSTVDTEATEDKANITELMTALSQFMTGVSPLVENGSMPFEAAQAILLSVVRRFRFGPEVEDQLKKMKPPTPPEPEKPSPEEMEMQKAEHQAKLQELQMKLEAMKLKAQSDAQKAQLEMQKMQLEAQLAQEELQMKREQMQMDMAARREQMQMDRIAGQQQMQMKQQSSQMDMQNKQQQAALGLQVSEATAQQKIKQSKQQADAKPAGDKKS